MAAGLRAFDQRDNPGRGQLTVHGGVRVFLDFGHNADGVRAVMQLVSRLRQAPHPRGRLTVVTGSAGDRTDRELAEVAAAICEGSPDRVLVRELPHYLRGRALGEVSAVLVRERRQGISPPQPVGPHLWWGGQPVGIRGLGMSMKVVQGRHTYHAST